MAFALRRPFAITQALKQQLPTASRQVFRSFHQEVPKRSIFQRFAPPKQSTNSSPFRDVFQKTFKRHQSQTSYNPASRGDLTQRLIYGGAIFGGTLLAINLVFNRETREGGIPAFEQQYLNDTFMHTGLGIGIIAIAARTLHANGWSYRLMSANPWLVLGVGLVGSIGTMIACRATPPEK